MKIVCFLYPSFTAIDLIGPVTAWNMIPDTHFEFVATSRGPVRTDTGLEVTATHDLSTCTTSPDVVFVPGGGITSFEAIQDDKFLDTIALASSRATWITSVCTGSLILGAAGLLRGYRAASYWYARPYLERFGAIPDDSRVVIDRNRASGGGVTAGIDFGLLMAAEWTNPTQGATIELLMEYAPQSPFDSGRPELASSDVLARAIQLVGPEMPETLILQAAKRRGFAPSA
ncbi:DJ-1/PfpI family protein [Bradyrhizobium tropiciagri]|uniref:DJ-1/PfpI family protein n=1 Tax=Bradyrhizobium tropiciagri TaxID=312253 RepID=UPI001BAB8C32|nr:DJ-1/PfpI family protein [Bradyrhizobium tropiciagri]MBR0896715.1 DJ-1/PfpI family protein [Bradyrhizobium tropiciagri]